MHASVTRAVPSFIAQIRSVLFMALQVLSLQQIEIVIRESLVITQESPCI